jgi:hypothetical protein
MWLLATPASAHHLWGAVAYGPGGAWAYAYDYTSRAAAQQAALQKCGGRCERTLTFTNGCGAYVVASNGAYGWGTDYNKDPAIERAMQECRARGQGCQLRAWSCTTRH